MNNSGPSRNVPGTTNAAQNRQAPARSTVAQAMPAGPRNTSGATAGGQVKKPAQTTVQAAQSSVQAAQAQARGANTSVTRVTATGTIPTPTAATTATPSAATRRAQIPPAHTSQAPPPPAALARLGLGMGTGIPSDILHDLQFGLYEALTLQGMEYVILGGVALQLLGSTRPTSQIDLYVPDGKSFETLKALRVYGKDSTPGITPFSHVPGNGCAEYNGLDGRKYRVNVWYPQQIGLPFPEAEDVVETKFLARIPKPAVLLNHKCYRWTGHEDCGDEKSMARDAGDILFLLAHMRKNNVKTSRQEVGYATQEFFTEFFKHVPREKERLFRDVGL